MPPIELGSDPPARPDTRLFLVDGHLPEFYRERVQSQPDVCPQILQRDGCLKNALTFVFDIADCKLPQKGARPGSVQLSKVGMPGGLKPTLL